MPALRFIQAGDRFRPQYFSQNEDTTGCSRPWVLSTTAVQSRPPGDAGHEADYAPYRASGEGYDFTAVPFTTVAWGERRCTSATWPRVRAEMMTGEQWGQVLQEGLMMPLPMIGPSSPSSTATTPGDGPRGLLRRLRHDARSAGAEGATFVTSSELVATFAQ